MRPQYAVVTLGTLGALFPEALIDWTKRVLLGPGFENATDLEPRTWYVAAVRIQAVLVALAGVAWLLLERRQPQIDAPERPDLTPED
ncbi:MAG: hypothetical protein ABEJ84_01835 [Halodesulfurarchaeum sp.]